MKIIKCFLFLIVCLFSTSFRQTKTIERIIILDLALNDLLTQHACIQVLADGFDRSESPSWAKQDEYLLFSNLPQNNIDNGNRFDPEPF